MRRLFIGIFAIASLNLYPMNVMASDRLSPDRLDPLPNNTLIAKGLHLPGVPTLSVDSRVDHLLEMLGRFYIGKSLNNRIMSK